MGLDITDWLLTDFVHLQFVTSYSIQMVHPKDSLFEMYDITYTCPAYNFP
jgi:hypothetical protein